MNLDEYYNYLIDCGIVSEETLDIITNINGYCEETLDDVLYCVSGYNSIEQYLEHEDKETYREYYDDDDDDESEDEDDEY